MSTNKSSLRRIKSTITAVVPIALALSFTACTSTTPEKVDHAEIVALDAKQRQGLGPSARAVVEARANAHEAKARSANADHHVAWAVREFDGNADTSAYQEAMRSYLEAEAIEAHGTARVAEARYEMVKAMVVGRRAGESTEAYDSRLEDLQEAWVDAKQEQADAKGDTSERLLALNASRSQLATAR